MPHIPPMPENPRERRKRLELENAEVVMLLSDYVKIEEAFARLKKLTKDAYETGDIPTKQNLLREAIELLKDI